MGDWGGLRFFKDLRFCRSRAYMLMHYAHVAAVPCVLTFGGQEPWAMLERCLRGHTLRRDVAVADLAQSILRTDGTD